MQMSRNRPSAKPYISPITDEERMADIVLRTAKRMVKVGMHCPISQADLVEVETERDRLRQLRGYTSKKHRSASNA
jgi:hypothetical protein